MKRKKKEKEIKILKTGSSKKGIRCSRIGYLAGVFCQTLTIQNCLSQRNGWS